MMFALFCPRLAQNRHGAMSDLSPLCAQKQTLTKTPDDGAGQHAFLTDDLFRAIEKAFTHHQTLRDGTHLREFSHVSQGLDVEDHAGRLPEIGVAFERLRGRKQDSGAA
jgi:hypothetical protein